MGGQIPGAIPSPLPTSLSNHRVSVHLLCSPFPPLTHTREFFHTHTHTLPFPSYLFSLAQLLAPETILHHLFIQPQLVVIPLLILSNVLRGWCY